jgi:glycerol-3-phosphate O-acyltransferase
MLQDYKRLKQMLRFDFVWSGDECDEPELKQALGYYEAQSDEEELKNFAGLIANFLESYLIALKTLLNQGPGQIGGKEFVARAQKIGAQNFALREIERPEAVSNLNFENALQWMKAEKWLIPEGANLRLAANALKYAQTGHDWLLSLLTPIKYF